MGVVTDSLYFDTLEYFKNSFLTDEHYLFGSSLTNDVDSNNSERSRLLFLEKTIFGKKIDPDDVLYMIRRVTWVSGTVYTQYDDTQYLHNTNFFVIVEPESGSGDYHIFKCISNNYGSASVDKPVYSDSIIPQNYILQTSDGYIWKYMFSVTDDQENMYSTPELFPVVLNPAVTNSASGGVDNIIVENPSSNYGYESSTGIITSIKSIDDPGNVRVIYINSQNFNPIRRYYSGYSLYATSDDGVSSRLYEISDSGVDSSNQRQYISVRGYVSGDITNPTSTTWSFSILPTVSIIGDGSGAKAIPRINDQRITSIQILDRGHSYTRALARITPPSFGFSPTDPLSRDVSCILRPVLLKGGHGSDAPRELGSRHVLIYAQLTDGDESTIPTTNAYSKAGIVKSPEFTSNTAIFDNRISVEVETLTQLNVGDVVTQPTTNFKAVIHQLDSINNLIYLTEFNGPYIDQAATDDFYISGIQQLDETEPLTTPAGRISIVTGGIQYPPYINMTGDVLYITDFQSVERKSNLREQFKFIISF